MVSLHKDLKQIMLVCKVKMNVKCQTDTNVATRVGQLLKNEENLSKE